MTLCSLDQGSPRAVSVSIGHYLIFPQPTRRPFAQVRVPAQDQVREELRKIPPIRYLTHKSAQAHSRLLTIGIPLPVYPAQVARHRLDCSSPLDELPPLRRELSATVKIVEQGDTA